MKKFKRRQKRAKETQKEFDTTKEDFLKDLRNWVEPVSRSKLDAKVDQIMLVDKKLVRKILDFDDEAEMEGESNQ